MTPYIRTHDRTAEAYTPPPARTHGDVPEHVIRYHQMTIGHLWRGQRSKHSDTAGKTGRPAKAVIASDGTRFEDARAAAKHFGVSDQVVGNRCRDGKAIGGVTIRYEEAK